MQHNAVLLPYGTNGLVGAAFESIRKPPSLQSTRTNVTAEVQHPLTPFLRELYWVGMLELLYAWYAEDTDASSLPDSDLSTPHNGSLQGEDIPVFF